MEYSIYQALSYVEKLLRTISHITLTVFSSGHFSNFTNVVYAYWEEKVETTQEQSKQIAFDSITQR